MNTMERKRRKKWRQRWRSMWIFLSDFFFNFLCIADLSPDNRQLWMDSKWPHLLVEGDNHSQKNDLGNYFHNLTNIYLWQALKKSRHLTRLSDIWSISWQTRYSVIVGRLWLFSEQSSYFQKFSGKQKECFQLQNDPHKKGIIIKRSLATNLFMSNGKVTPPASALRS